MQEWKETQLRFPGSGWSLGVGNGNPLLENGMRGTWQATINRLSKSRTWTCNWACMPSFIKSWIWWVCILSPNTQKLKFTFYYLILKSKNWFSQLWEITNILDAYINSFCIRHSILFVFRNNLIAVTISYITDSHSLCKMVRRGWQWLTNTDEKVDQQICRVDKWHL